MLFWTHLESEMRVKLNRFTQFDICFAAIIEIEFVILEALNQDEIDKLINQQELRGDLLQGFSVKEEALEREAYFNKACLKL
jgi:hypothetical protein